MTYTIALVLGGAGLALLLLGAVIRRRRRPADPATLRADVRAALDRGADVLAVRLYRERTGAGLLEARDEVARIGRERG
ncbi:ribosomal protein L7/L12 [Catenuloplanes nepalensis]|uniref:Ribosomal protein L7/L12 n=1 Tax=Catenuloplanes nepalensis TaxID=587533 RepID=A0ABT9MMW7_9ACTN|nr:hypothetical protein [Catenuloplanes nepalensis]MDP9792752.1 ribosomal protein L7/L12 [Catenuloplanes nepalensis]